MQVELTPTDRHLQSVIRQFEIAPCRALEIGCATGTNLIWLASQGFECVGIDVASALLRIARDKAAEVDVDLHLVRGTFPEDATERHFTDGTFDFIFDRGVLELITLPSEQRRFLKRIQQLLTVGGTYYSLVAKKERRQLPGGGTRWTAAQFRKAVSPYLKVVITRPVPQDPADRTSPACLLCIMRKHDERRLKLSRRFPFVVLR